MMVKPDSATVCTSSEEHEALLSAIKFNALASFPTKSLFSSGVLIPNTELLDREIYDRDSYEEGMDRRTSQESAAIIILNCSLPFEESTTFQEPIWRLRRPNSFFVEEGYSGGEEEDGADEDSYPLEDSLHSPTIPSSEAHDGSQSVPLPVFLEEPTDTYIIKNKPATLQCRASHALQVYFKCNGGRVSENSVQQEFVDPQTGVRNVEASVNITRDDVEEYFGKDKFKCECIAWSSRGNIRSQPAVLDVAYCFTYPFEYFPPSKVPVRDHGTPLQPVCLIFSATPVIMKEMKKDLIHPH
ncbi:unnamed protein product [Nezara viridula]|uniref:Netrin receptor UNC5A-D-like N-terminal domain-containing protein n=1 Tax=Nezara viridula TaxID=85310 RepID=A0A9P0E338_NEZVI|nr:unnamed protein product [Nezara viridula]